MSDGSDTYVQNEAMDGEVPVEPSDGTEAPAQNPTAVVDFDPVEPSDGTEALAQNPTAVVDFDPLELLARGVVDTVIFDDTIGSAKLIVEDGSGENVAFVVSSDAMVRACRPWKCTLAGLFAAARPDHPKILDFTEDDYDSLKILMHIIHFKFFQVPTSLTITGLHRMAILTDKYFATSLVSPWILRWVEAVQNTINGPSAPLWLWIAWEYGLLDKFNRVSHMLAMGISNKQLLMRYNDKRLTWRDFPPGVLDTVMEMRTEAINLLLNPIYEYLESLLSAADVKNETNISKPAEASSNWRHLCRNLRKDCFRLQAGSLAAGLRAYGLWPGKDTSKIRMTPRQLAERLLYINVSDCNNNDFSWPTSERADFEDTCGSFSNILDKIREIKSDGYCISTAKHRSYYSQYMEKQRRLWDRDWKPGS